MDWKTQASMEAEKNCTVIAMRNRAQWHRERGMDFLNNSVRAMAQHDDDARALDAAADMIVQEHIANAGVKAGVYESAVTGFDRVRGKYVEVRDEKGWRCIWSEKLNAQEAVEMEASDAYS